MNTTNTTAKKRIMALALALILLLLALTRVTLSYFTDTKKATNTFTYGSVSIKQYENNTPIDNGQGLSYTNFLPIATTSSDINDIRSDPNYQKKSVKVELDANSSDAYIRTFIRVPAAVMDASHPILHLDIVEGTYNGWNQKVEYTYTDAADNTEYKVISFTHPVALSNTGSGSNTKQTPFFGVYLDAKVNAVNGCLYHIDNGVSYPGTPVVSANQPLKIDVVTQAVQADGFASAEMAFNAAFSNKDPWNNTVSTPNP